MSYTPKQAWRNASRLLAICLGFSQDQRRRITKVSQRYNESNGYHEIMLKLEIRHDSLFTGKNVVYEQADDAALSLIQEINHRAELGESDSS